MLALLDVRTLIVTCAILFAGVTLALTFIWRQTRGVAGLGQLALAHGLTVVGAVLIGTQRQPGFASAVLGNSLLVLAVALLNEGTRLFVGLSAQRRQTLILAPAAAAAFATFLYLYPSEPARALIYSGLQALLFGRAAWITQRRGRRERAGPAMLLMALALWAQSVTLALRFGLVLVSAPAGQAVAILSLMVPLIAVVAWTIGLVSTVNRRLMRSVSESKQLFENLVAVARATTEGPSLKATLQGTLEVANRLTGAAASSLMLADEAGRITRALHTRGAVAAVFAAPASGRVMSEGLAGWVARRREAALVSDTLEDERWVRVTVDDLPARSALAVPISSGATLVGVLTLVHAEPGHFTEEHRHLMDAAATQIALALRNAQISDARLRLAGRQSLLYEVLRASSRPLDSGEIAQAAADAIAMRTRYQHVVVALPGADGLWRLHGRSAGLADVHMPLAAGVVGRAFRSGLTQVVPDVSRDPDYTAGAETIRSELAIPLRSADRALGVLNLESDVLDAFGADDVQLAESLAEAITLGLENGRLYREISGQSARLAAVIASSRDGLLLVGGDRRVLLMNEPALLRLGLHGAPGDWTGRNVDELIQALAPAAPQVAEVVRGLSAGHAAAEGEWALGASVLEWLDLPVPSLGRLLVVRDVSQVRHAERMRETLAHMMVHDLRSPLSGVLGALEMLEQSAAAVPNAVRLVQLARANAQRQLRLINAILDVSRLEQGTVPLDRSRTALPEVVGEVLRLAVPLAVGKEVELRAETAPDLPVLCVDHDLIVRVLENLVANAIKFSPSGERVLVSAGLDGDAAVRVAVHDKGPGVSPDVLPRLFEKFAPGAHRGHGSGLGLAFCRLAVEAHGGRIWLEPPGEAGGATFAFTLPLDTHGAA